MDLQTILIIVSSILGVVAIVLGERWVKAKGKLSQVTDLAKEVYELVDAATSALDDDKISPEEVNKIKQEAAEVKAAWRILIGKD